MWAVLQECGHPRQLKTGKNETPRGDENVTEIKVQFSHKCLQWSLVCVYIFMFLKKYFSDWMTYFIKYVKINFFHWQKRIKFSWTVEFPSQFRGSAAKPTSRPSVLACALLSDNMLMCFSERFILLLNSLGRSWFLKHSEGLFETEAQNPTNLHLAV